MLTHMGQEHMNKTDDMGKQRQKIPELIII